MPILLSHRKRRYEDRIVQLNQGVLAEVDIGHRARFMVVHRQQALIHLRFRRENRLVAEQNMEKRQVRNVTAQNHHAHRQRCRENQAGGSPQSRPKHCGQQDRQRRDSRMHPIKPRLNEIAGHQLQRGEQQEYQERRHPMIENRQ